MFNWYLGWTQPIAQQPRTSWSPLAISLLDIHNLQFGCLWWHKGRMLAYEDVDEGLIPGITTNFLFQLTLGKTLSLETTVFSFSLSLSLSRSLSLLNLWENSTLVPLALSNWVQIISKQMLASKIYSCWVLKPCQLNPRFKGRCIAKLLIQQPWVRTSSSSAFWGTKMLLNTNFLIPTTPSASPSQSTRCQICTLGPKFGVPCHVALESPDRGLRLLSTVDEFYNFKPDLFSLWT